MADIVLAPLVGKLVETLVSGLPEEARMVWRVDEDLKTLSETLESIQDVLADVEEMQITMRAVQRWLRKLKDIACDADDVLDEYQYEALRQKAERDQKNEGKGKRVREFFPFSCFPRSHELAKRIKSINGRLATVWKERENFGFLKDVGISRVNKLDTERPPASSVPAENESGFLGRNEDKKKIIELLLSDDTCGGKRAYSVISIVGMGGLGKTTLAQHVYNDKRVKEHFEVRAWACVSEKFDVSKITADIIKSAKRGCDSSSIDPLQCGLVDVLKEKRFLIVLDDVWNEERDPWDRLQAPFNYGARGSRILVTTRHQQVSEVMYANHLYHMKALENKECFELFLQHAFAGEGHDADPELMQMGEELVEKRCQGLPLAAKVLGGLLYRKDSSFWKRILNSQIWISGDQDNKVDEVVKVLRVSYHHLRPHIKQCFAFCSIFPEDYEFEKDELVRLWMAQGFIEPVTSMLLEERGSQYFDHLLQRSFFQENDRFSSTYKMHDCIHNLAVSVSNEECLRIEHDATNPTPNDRLRHLSLLEAHTGRRLEKHTGRRLENLRAFNQCKRLRTLRIGKGFFLSSRNMLCQQAINDLVNFKCLRALILSDSKIEELPDSISDLKHLRYLGLFHVSIKQLPESLCSLYNLQTLMLQFCSNFCSWPRETRKLINLRHLHFDYCDKLRSMPSEVGKLSSLQTISPCFWMGIEGENKIGELKGLAQLRGRVKINILTEVSNAEEAKEACLKDKVHIQELSLCWYDREVEFAEMLFREEASIKKESGEILEALQPHKNLESLRISGYQGTIYPTWLQAMELPNLKFFYIDNCGNCTSVPPLGQFRRLEKASISGMHSVKRIGRELYGDGGEIKGSFPLLKKFTIRNMSNLEEWCEPEEEGGEFSHLQVLGIDDCPKLTKMPIYSSTVEGACFPMWPSLDKLVLGYSNERLLLDSVPRLTSLSRLTIESFCKLKSLPKGMLHALPNLKHLEIFHCSKLESLVDDEYEGLPSTLVSLEIYLCYRLKPLGEKCLPPTLQSLVIRDCTQLKIEDLAKISHIPYIKFDDKIISQ